MKYFFTTIFLSLILNLSHAKEVVTVYWGWGAADSLANISRTLVHEANQIQDKYTFVFDVKPGAGGAIAAEYIRRTPNTILATSSAFFIRPNVYPTTNNYKINEFKTLLPQCYSPISITSSKYKAWSEVPVNQNLFISNAGMGSTTHLVGMQINSRFSNLTPVSFKSVAEAFHAMVAGHVDFDVGFLGSVDQWKKENTVKKLNVIGISGSDRSFNYPLLIDQGFPATLGSIYLPQHLVVSNDTPSHKFQEWQDILAKAAKSPRVRESYKDNYCNALDDMPTKDIPQWFNSQTVLWKRLSSGINLENLTK